MLLLEVKEDMDMMLLDQQLKDFQGMKIIFFINLMANFMQYNGT